MQEALDMAAIKRQGKTGAIGLFRQLQSERMGLSNRMSSLVSSMQSPASAGLQTLNAAASGFNAGLGYLNTSQQESFFNTSEGTNP